MEHSRPPLAKRPLIIYPVLLALYLVVHAFERYRYLLPFDAIIRPALVVTGGTVMLWLLLRWLIHDARKSAAVASLILCFVFSYGPLSTLWERLVPRRLDDQPLAPMLVLWGALVIVASWLIIKSHRRFAVLTSYLNLFVALLLAMPLITIVLKVSSAWGRQQVTREPLPLGRPSPPAALPDIYYIILDSYARADALQGLFQYRNASFLDHLIQKGFHVVERGRANYSWTMPSLASSLNFTHLDQLADRPGEHARDWRPLHAMIRQSRVAQFLKSYGYRVVVFPSMTQPAPPVLSMTNADLYMAPPWLMNGVEYRLLHQTPLSAFRRFSTYHRDHALYIFDHLPDLATGDAPVFVFAHILATHPPFMRNPPRWKNPLPYVSYSKDGYVRDYVDAVTVVNDRLTSAIDAILARSRVPPIIILQGDHGPHWKGQVRRAERSSVDEDTDRWLQMVILNAYYLPMGGQTKLYDEITPVNTFRVIFNHYFGTKLELLNDDSYYSSWSHAYRFVNVTDELKRSTQSITRKP